MTYTPLHNYGSPALARMIRDGRREEHGRLHPATAAAQGRLDALLGRSAPGTGVGRVSYARQKGQAGHRNRGARSHFSVPSSPPNSQEKEQGPGITPSDGGTPTHPSAIAAQAGRRAAAHPAGVMDVGIPIPASVAFQRATGNAGWCNRTARRHGFAVEVPSRPIAVVDRRDAA